MNRIPFVFAQLCLALFVCLSPFAAYSQETCFPVPENVIRLSDENLEKLNIHSDASGIIYIVNDGNNSFVTFLREPGGISRQSSRHTGAEWNNAKAECILACNGFIEYRTIKSYKDYYAIPNTEDLIPIYVPVPGNEQYLIFWFPNTPEIVDLLPSENRNALKKNASVYQINLEKLLEKWSPEEREVAERKENKTRFESMVQEPNVFAIGKRYKELNIDFIEGKYKAGDKRTSVEWEKDGYSRGIISIAQQLKATDPNDLRPLMITPEPSVRAYDTSFAVRVATEWNPTNEFILGDNWEEEKHRLVGFLVEDAPDARCIVWYAYSPAIQSILSPDEKKKAEAFLNWDFTLHSYGLLRLVRDYRQLQTDKNQPNNKMAIPSISPVQFAELGFKLDGEGNLCFPFSSGGYNSYMVLNDSYNGRSDSMSRHAFDTKVSEMAKVFGKYLVGITDERGLGPFLVNENIDRNLNWSKLIPVRVALDKPFSTMQQGYMQSPGVIFWFLPESGIQDRLGKVEGFEWKLKSVEADMSKVNGELTQATWMAPYIYEASWKSAEKVPVTIQIFDLNGLMIYSETLEKLKKKNKLSLPASLLRAGFYTITFTTESGDFHQFPFIIPHRK